MASFLVYFDLGLKDKDLFLTRTPNNISDVHLSLLRIKLFHLTLILYFAMFPVKLSHIYTRKALYFRSQDIKFLSTLDHKQH